MTEPYYRDDAVTLYHGDCLEITEWLAADVLVTDPPYGIALDTSSRDDWLPDHAPVAGDADPFDPAPLLALNKPTCMWGANHYASRLHDAKGWVVWDKATRNGLDLKQAEVEFAWTNYLARPKCFRHMWSGAYRDSECGTRYHPTQKPVALLTWLLQLTPAGVVADPYAGSGSTLVAAKYLGRKAIGVELEERYCEVIARRLAQDVLDFGGEAS